MKKFTLPHSETELQAQRDMIGSLKASLDAAQETLRQLIIDNDRAQRAENVRKAQILTAKDREILAALLPADAWLECWSSFSSHRTTYHIHGYNINVTERQFDKLHMAGYIGREVSSTFRNNRYTLTDAGRKVLDTK